MTTYKDEKIRINPVTKISPEDLRDLCIKQNWCTKMDTVRYGAFLKSFGYTHLDTKKVYDMATTIFNYSDFWKYNDNSTKEMIENIMFLIMQKAYTFFDIRFQKAKPE